MFNAKKLILQFLYGVFMDDNSVQRVFFADVDNSQSLFFKGTIMAYR
ncbi:MAG: hypothetical protein CM15mP113_0210 [Pseudomonadota bacterium]|nr:MAG: hypothetical protein CM15mP113_0210 [Pseudomonadota bacterium]